MQATKVMSIIGIVLFSLVLLGMMGVVAEPNPDFEAAAGFGFLGMFYALALAIVALVMSLKEAKKQE